MISWVEEGAAASADLTWDLDDEVLPASALSPADDASAALEAVAAVGERASLAEALAELASLLARRCRCDIAAVSFESTPGGGRLVAAAREDGFDDALSSALASLPGHELAGAVTSALPGAVVEAWSLPVGARASCTVWLARDAVAPVLDAALARAAGVALRAVSADEALQHGGGRSADLVQRDRREVVVGRLTRAAAAPLVAAHASLAAVQASLASELAELRMTSPRHASIRASVALLQEAIGLTHGAWQVVSGVACLGDDDSASCDPAQVIQAAAALAAPYLAPRASVEVATGRLPAVRVSPAALAEALVVFLTRAAQRFTEGAGRVAVTASATGDAVEVEVRALAAPDAHEGRGHDEVVADAFHRALAERFGGAAEVVRDAAGGQRFRLTLPTA